MAQYYQTYYTTGEFAKICHTTKETLFHYDNIDLLKPAIVKDNGYRYYLATQYYEFDMIKVLQQAHMSLQEIKDFLKQKNQYSFIELLKEKNKELENEKNKIIAMQKRIQQTISMIQYGLETKPEIPFLEECEEEHLLSLRLPIQPKNDQEAIHYIYKHIEYCREHHLSEEFPLGTIVLKEHLLQKHYVEDYYYVKLEHKVDDEHYVYKPKGLYAKILHQGYYDTVKYSFDILMQYIQEKGYQICSDAYEYEIHNYLTVDNSEEYLILLSVKVC